MIPLRPHAPLDDVEWGGDAVTALVLVLLGLAFFALGFAWGRRRAIVLVALVLAVPTVALDALYFGAGVDLPGYCGEPECDPGPIPASLGLAFLPVPLALTTLGVALRRSRS